MHCEKKKPKNLRVKSFQCDGSHFQVVLWNISLVFHGFVLRFSPFFKSHISAKPAKLNAIHLLLFPAAK